MKRFLRRLFASKRKWLMIAIAVVMAIVLYLGISLLAVNPARLSLEGLRRSFRDEPVCRQACIAERQKAGNALAGILEEHPDSKGAKLIEEYFLDEENGDDFRISLIGVIKQAVGSYDPPSYVADAFRDSDNPAIRAAILAAFDPTALGGKDDPIGYYYGLVADDRDMEVRLAAIRAIGATDEKSSLFHETQLDDMSRLILDSETDKHLRQSLVLLSGDYYPLFPEKTKDMLIAFYRNDISGDSISRAFAADILNRLGGEDFSIPEISASEWDEYYNY